MSFCLGLSAGFLGACLSCLGNLRLLLGETLLLFDCSAFLVGAPILLLNPVFLLRFLAALALDQRELRLLFGAPCRELRLLRLQGFQPLRLRFAFSRELGEVFRLLAFTFALGRDVLSLAPALHSFELVQPALFFGPAASRGLRLLLELLDSIAFFLAPLLIVLAQAFELIGDLLLVDDHRFDRLDPGAGRKGGRRVCESEDEHRRHRDMKQNREHDRQQPIEQRISVHCRVSRGASVISPTLGAPARCRIVISRTTSP